MVEYLTTLTILLLALNIESTSGENLWCYNCNTNLRHGHKNECNDPYVPGYSMDLTPCPRNESHHCLKSIILYKSILVTVRACVPSRKIDHYCQHEEYYPHSSIECYFCKDYACNDHPPMKPTSVYTLGIIVMLVLALSSMLTRTFHPFLF
ncbi:hypothetical protein KPH14_003949 [Odynerus spinipes]|uniref:Protein sleepless n=1 Tax=Odynerus spinipes TaxID=1348599 RepID=A0AAD9VVN9_9HYME|nr:hypothetical protein KPH14_003949 [Odynerus spinipes]